MDSAIDLSARPLAESNPFLNAVQPSLKTQSHLDLLRWLQGDLQAFLPHEILLAAWGDANLEKIQIDLISPLPDMRTALLLNHDITPFLRSLFDRWRESGYDLFYVCQPDGFLLGDREHNPIETSFKRMRSALGHGIKDERGRNHYLYIVFSQAVLPPPFASEYLHLLIPHIDTALRRLAPLQKRNLELVPDVPRPAYHNYGLTLREKEIMDWVRAGKTNEVIGLILDISPFTVKNHLKRIFRKLGVTNRAQAVSKF